MSEQKRGRKRPKSYYIKCAAGGKKTKRVNDLDVGMRGFLVTCNKYERETVREMYNILNEYADNLYGPEIKADKPKTGESDSDSEEEDMEKAMAKDVQEMQDITKVERRFQNTDTKSKNCIFIRTTVEDPCSLAHKIFTDIVESQVQKARFALRLVPIAATCRAKMDAITETAKNIFKPHFETGFGEGIKYTSVCKIRNNQSLSRMVVLPELGKIIREMNPLHTLCHDEPELVVVVEVIRNICCLSVVKDYFVFRKYNFHEVLKKPENDEKTNEDKEEKNDNEIIVDNVKPENEDGSVAIVGSGECTALEHSGKESNLDNNAENVENVKPDNEIGLEESVKVTDKIDGENTDRKEKGNNSAEVTDVTGATKEECE